ncbi:MAG TPA: class I SAM-dependent methyltransferase [Burkholderiales bacterium]|nr:class I SAM-dependent methyltransferase [Burkholderiales bacterium]
MEMVIEPSGGANKPFDVSWTEGGEVRYARWLSENGAPPPKRVIVAKDDIRADAAYRLASEGTAILWRGDYHNARQILNALAHRLDRKPYKSSASTRETFHLNRQRQAQRAHTLGMLLLPFETDYAIPLRRAPDVRQACLEAFGPADGPSLRSLRELLGAIGAHEWRKKGIEVESLGARVHPHYGVFAPVRQEYVRLVAEAPLPATTLAYDIGTGTGVLAAVLARRGLQHVVATENDPRALECARENIERLGLDDKVEVVQADLYPAGRAPLLVCNPPWIPTRPSSSMEQAIYDPDSRMLRGFLAGAGEHLAPGGEAWLVLSDIAEHLGLRSREALLRFIDEAGLAVVGRLDTRPQHPKALDPSDPLHAARSAEVTSLWRLITP